MHRLQSDRLQIAGLGKKMIMNSRPTNERINTLAICGNFLHCSKASYEIIDFFEFLSASLLANPSQLRYVGPRYGTFPAISDAF
jgi:hypothetical protein